MAILDGSVDVTGALNSARGQARMLRDDARFVLFLPIQSHAIHAAASDFEAVERVRLPELKRSLGGVLGYPFASLASARMLARRLRELDCERLQINDFYLLPGLLTRLFGFRGRIVTWVRIDPRRYGLAGKIWLFAAQRFSNLMVSVSKYISACLPPSVKTKLIYDSSLLRAVTEANRDPQSMLFVGNYIFGKGQQEAISAFQLIADRFPSATLVFHGGDMGLGKNRDYLAGLRCQAAAGPGTERILFGPFLSDLADARGRAGMALNFSHSESFSLTCVEASANGLAVIATRCGGPEEIVEDGVTGLLVPVGDTAAMAEAMAGLLGDPDRAATMGEAGCYLVAERFSPAAIRSSLVKALGLGTIGKIGSARDRLK
ncbi:glycosyltransferase family 4 protein [Sphingomonas sp. RB1R13]|uniref:glycosyltransferase family 4 protein n=1 Tax=Sphingomonas sp. RB1R13 TaxID=3096159 RepID=UPI002FC83ABE